MSEINAAKSIEQDQENDFDNESAFDRDYNKANAPVSNAESIRQKYANSKNWTKSEQFGDTKDQAYIDSITNHLFILNHKNEFEDINNKLEQSGQSEKLEQVNQRIKELISQGARELPQMMIDKSNVEATQTYDADQKVQAGYEFISRIEDDKIFLGFELFDFISEEDLNPDSNSFLAELDDYDDSDIENKNNIFGSDFFKTQTPKILNLEKATIWQSLWNDLFIQSPQAHEQRETQPNIFDLFTPLSPALETPSESSAQQEVPSMTFELFSADTQTESVIESFIPNPTTEFTSSIISLDKAVRESDSATETNVFEEALISIQVTPDTIKQLDDKTETDASNFENSSDDTSETYYEGDKDLNNFKLETFKPILKEVDSVVVITNQETSKTYSTIKSEPKEQILPTDTLKEVRVLEPVIKIQETADTKQLPSKEVTNPNMPPVTELDEKVEAETSIVKNDDQFTENSIPSAIIENQPAQIEAPTMVSEAQIERRTVTQEFPQVINIVETVPEVMENMEPASETIKNTIEEQSAIQEVLEINQATTSKTTIPEPKPVVILEKTADTLETTEDNNNIELAETSNTTEAPSIYIPVVETVRQTESATEAVLIEKGAAEEATKPQQIQKVQENNRPVLQKASFERFDQQTKDEQIKTTEAQEVTEPKTTSNIERVEKTVLKQSPDKVQDFKTPIIEKTIKSPVREQTQSKVLEGRVKEMATYTRFEQALKALEKVAIPEAPKAVTKNVKLIREQKPIQKEVVRPTQPTRYVQYTRENKAATFNEVVSIVRQINQEQQPSLRFDEAATDIKKKQLLEYRAKAKKAKFVSLYDLKTDDETTQQASAQVIKIAA